MAQENSGRARNPLYCAFPFNHPFNYLPGYSVHTFNKLVPPDVYFKEHPEYYSLDNGQRNPNLLCLSNLAVFETALAPLRNNLAAAPEGKWIVSISQNDCGGGKRLKTEQLSINYMILEQWNSGRIQRSPQAILALLDDAEKECANSRIRGLTEHD